MKPILLPIEKLFVFLDDVYVVCQPDRARLIFDLLSDALTRRKLWPYAMSHRATTLSVRGPVRCGWARRFPPAEKRKAGAQISLVNGLNATLSRTNTR